MPPDRAFAGPGPGCWQGARAGPGCRTTGRAFGQSSRGCAPSSRRGWTCTSPSPPSHAEAARRDPFRAPATACRLLVHFGMA